MLHEILYAMLGKLGSVILDFDGVFKVNPALEFISQAERELLEKIVVLGSFYAKIKSYIEEDDKMFHQKMLSVGEEKEENEQEVGGMGSSAYVRAICYSVRLLLSEYEKEVLAVEQDYLTSKVYTFSKLTVSFSRFYYVFPEAILMFESIEEYGFKGGQLIDFVYNSSINGNQIIKDFYNALLEKLFSVFFHQLVNWILHGRLHDPYREFFIQRLVPEAVFESQHKHEEWNSTFAIKHAMIPKRVLPTVTAEKILFIGKYVRVVSRARDTSDIKHYSRETLSLIKSLSVFEYSKFQDVIEMIRSEVGREFLKLFLKEENIEEHLRFLKDYYLLGRGDFFQIFLEEADALFRAPPTKYSENDINNVILPAVLMRLNMSESKVSKLIHFSISNIGFDYKDFINLPNLHKNGDVTVSNMIKLGAVKKGPTEASLYNTVPQPISTGFDIKVAFKFKRELSDIDVREAIPSSIREQEKLGPNVTGINSLAIVIQSSLDLQSRRW